ncbi:hypothetical protein OKI_04431 [Enterococcus faecium EnGen0038]|nr:hypothetical protein [Enterococcus faecium]ELB51012.1 hypothetical protein OKI_04431 [Enterococcus faecium EnGen0038]
MNDFTTEIVQTLVTKGDLNELLRGEKLLCSKKSRSLSVAL